MRFLALVLKVELLFDETSTAMTGIQGKCDRVAK